MVKAVSVREPERAVEMCREFKFLGNIEGCIINLAEFKQDARFCDEIKRTKGKDSCYIQVIFKTGQFQFCNRIMDENTKQSCSMLSKADEMTKLAEQGQTDEVQLMLETFPLSSLSHFILDHSNL